MMEAKSVTISDKNNNRRWGTSHNVNWSYNSGGVVCYYCHEPGHTKRTCKKLQNRYQKPHSTHIAATTAPPSSSSEKTIMVSSEEFAKFSEYQKALRSSSNSITTVAESGKPNTCLISSSSKWVIDSGATDHMTGNPSLFSTFQSHTSPSNVTLADGSTSCVLGSGTINQLRHFPCHLF